MKKQATQPNPTDIQAIQQLVQAGRLPQAEVRIRALLANCPDSLALHNLMGFCLQGQGKNREAANSFRKMLAIGPRIAEIHFNLAVILAQLGDDNDAITSYRNTLQLKPDFTTAHFNLGTLLQAQGQLRQAAEHYRQAIAIQPGFFEALGNLGTVLQQQGLLQEAEHCYRKALAIKPDALGYFNLGTTLYGQGQHSAAITAFRAALNLNPDFADAWNSLGETLRDQGSMAEAIRCYEQALAKQPGHGRATYNLGEYHCLAGRLQEAIPYFERSGFADAQQRVLQCLYKTRQFGLFAEKFSALLAENQPASVLMGTLSTHYAINFGLENSYPFCKSPMDYVTVTRINELAEPTSPLLKTLLHDIHDLAIAERKQGRLYYGTQSAGNLLKRTEATFQQLAVIIRRHITEYQQRFSGSKDALMVNFPQEIDFTSSWYLRMKQGGYLTSHIHEEGWISGCIYLKLPQRGSAHEGSFVYGTDGDDYPRLHDNFPSQIVDVQVGDLVLFPSSLFHRTIPFHSNEERVCVAFDVKPAATGLSF